MAGSAHAPKQQKLATKKWRAPDSSAASFPPFPLSSDRLRADQAEFLRLPREKRKLRWRSNTANALQRPGSIPCSRSARPRSLFAAVRLAFIQRFSNRNDPKSTRAQTRAIEQNKPPPRGGLVSHEKFLKYL